MHQRQLTEAFKTRAYSLLRRAGRHPGHRSPQSRKVREKCEYIDYKDAAKLRRFISERSKILPRRTLKAALPIQGAVILVAISALLTIIAGLIPSRVAAKKDPVARPPRRSPQAEKSLPVLRG